MVNYNLTWTWTKKTKSQCGHRNKKMDVSFQLWLCFVSIRNFEVCVLRVSLDKSFQKISGKVTLDQVDHCWSLGFHSISTMHFIDFHLHAKLQTQVHHFFEARTDSCFLRSHAQKPWGRLARTEPLVGSKDCEAVYASHFLYQTAACGGGWRIYFITVHQCYLNHVFHIESY